MKYHVLTEGMGCPRCMAKVTKAVSALGADMISMELNDFTLGFGGDPALIREAVEALGFKVISVEAV